MSGNKTINNWASFLKRATKDAQLYLTSVKKWSDGDDTSSDLFLKIVTARVRTGGALQILSKDCPDEYVQALESLKNTANQAEDTFLEILQKNNLQGVFDSLLKRLDELENQLGDFCKYYEEEHKYNDEELKENLRKSGSDFLEHFIRHNYLYRQCSDLSLTDDLTHTYKERFARIEENFRSLFYLFHPLKDILTRYQKDEYIPESYWWLSEELPSVLRHEDQVDTLINEGFKEIKKQKPKEECPPSDLLAAYAFDELEGEQKTKLENHLTRCFKCLDEVTELRHIHATTEIPSYEKLDKRKEDIKLPEKIISALEDEEPEKRGKGTVIGADVLKRKREKKSSGFSTSGIKNFVPLLAAASLAVIIGVGVFMQQRPIPVSGEMTFKINVSLRGDSSSEEFEPKSGVVLDTEDMFKIEFQTEKDGYICIFQQDNQGRTEVLAENIKTTAGTLFKYPEHIKREGGSWKTLTKENPGDKRIYFLSSSKPVKQFENKIDKLKSQDINAVKKSFPKAFVQSFDYELIKDQE